MTVDLSALPWPIEPAAVIVRHALESVWWAFITPTRNVAQLGPWWPPCYWAAVYGLAHLGAWGSARMRTVRRGADFFEFDPTRRGGQWAGRWAIGVIRLQVAGEAWGAAAAVIAGYGGLIVLLAVGLVWRWLPLVAVGVLWWMWRARTRTAWWEQQAP